MEKMNYKISSRATILLGRESVSKVDGAIIELVKNTYDADASLCYICMDTENDKIYILDNGIGMTRKIIENQWMMIGTENKKTEYISEKNRVKSGEKGIGRFALDRLGNKCEMYTKNKAEDLILWKNDWSSFEEQDKLLSEIEAEFGYIEQDFLDVIPKNILYNINQFALKKETEISLETGTMFIISGLRDSWKENEIKKLVAVLEFLIPPKEQTEYFLCFQPNLTVKYEEISSEVNEDFDYKISAHFDGRLFNIEVNRNEFDVNIMPKELFDTTPFLIHPYTYKDFLSKVFKRTFSIEELTRNNDEVFLERVHQIGSFDFNYVYMKQSGAKEKYFYKQVSPKRKGWLSHHGGIKIYRDNFVVRPYGDSSSNAFDWLGLDARKGMNPVAISHKSGGWHVNNAQGQGTVSISRINNNSILDKSSREGIIENECFLTLCSILKSIISVFEQDRAYVVRNIKQYLDDRDKKAQKKEEAQNIAEEVLSHISNSEPTSNEEKLAEAVQYYKEEREELISEIKLLHSLATNGLITTSITHDLKSINALLVSRVDNLKWAIENNNSGLLERNLSDLKTNDEFLKSWITVITRQSNQDKRRRIKKDLNATIKESIALLEPILQRKKIDVKIETDGNEAVRRIFESDFDSIIYNLIINSIESFKESSCEDRVITVSLQSNENFTIHYKDNGHGLSKSFVSNPYDIFKYGTTSKFDKDGNQVGTGLGMYIVASSINEYNGRYTIVEAKDGFALDIEIPL